MRESELRAINPFGTLSVVSEDEADRLCRPDDPHYHDDVYKVADASVVADLLKDPQLVPKGTVRSNSGTVWAVFWQRRR